MLIYRLCWFTDLTERRQLESKRRQAERQFENAFRNAAIGMAISDLDATGIRANPAFCRLTGYSERELRQLDFAGITHPDDIAATYEGDERLLRGEASDYQLEKRYIHKDGEPVWALVSVSLDSDEDGEPQRYIVHVQDISLRKRMEADLSQAAAVAEMSRDLICTVGVDDRLARLDGRWSEVLGWSEEELKGRPLADFIHPDDRTSPSANWRASAPAAVPAASAPAGRRPRGTGPGCCGRCRAPARRARSSAASARPTTGSRSRWPTSCAAR